MKQLLFITCLLAGIMYSGYAQTSPGPPKRSMSLSVIEVVQSENSINLFFHTGVSGQNQYYFRIWHGNQYYPVD